MHGRPPTPVPSVSDAGSRGRADARPWRLLTIVLSVMLVVGITQPADAGEMGGYMAEGVNIRTGPATWYTSIGLGYTSHAACIWNYVNGPEGYLWANHTNLTTGVGPGYSASVYIGVDTPSQYYDTA